LVNRTNFVCLFVGARCSLFALKLLEEGPLVLVPSQISLIISCLHLHSHVRLRSSIDREREERESPRQLAIVRFSSSNPVRIPRDPHASALHHRHHGQVGRRRRSLEGPGARHDGAERQRVALGGVGRASLGQAAPVRAVPVDPRASRRRVWRVWRVWRPSGDCGREGVGIWGGGD